MIRGTVSLWLAVAVPAGVACQSGTKGQHEPGEVTTVALDVDGMHCGSCVEAITHALEAVDDVVNVTVDLDAGRATVQCRATVKPSRLIEIVDRLGFEAKLAQDQAST